MKIAIAQLNPTIGDISGNAEKILKVAKEAVNQNVNLLLTPELSLCGYPPKDLLLNFSFVNSMESKLTELAAKLPSQLTVLIGTVTVNKNATIEGEKPLYNSAVLVKEKKIEKVFNKRLLPTYDVFDEDRYFEAGRKANYFTINNIKIGVTVCEDLWNDELFWGKRNYEINPLQEVANLKPNLIINLSASPYTVGKQKTREAILNHAITRHQIPIIYTNQIGGNDDLVFDGYSVAFDSNNNLICRGKPFEEDLVICEYSETDKDLLKSSSTKINNLPSSVEEEIYKALVLGVQDYARKCGFSKAILGLSGGIDSAIVAKIAADALGKDNVLGVLMPSPYSSEHSVKDAQMLVKNLRIKSEKIAIQDIMKSYDRTLESLFANTEFGVAEENLQSRIRGNLLMALANKFGYLLLSTGNKSEMAVGYCTLYGDMNGGLAVICDVPKTMVFSLCRWLNREQEIIPHNIIIKPPSAELKPDQLDQDSLPAYDVLDDILEKFVNQHQSAKKIVESGHDKAIVDKVIKLIARAEFKRKQAPPGIKITDRAFGTGWRMPIASRWLDQF